MIHNSISVVAFVLIITLVVSAASVIFGLLLTAAVIILISVLIIAFLILVIALIRMILLIILILLILHPSRNPACSSLPPPLLRNTRCGHAIRRRSQSELFPARSTPNESGSCLLV